MGLAFCDWCGLADGNELVREMQSYLSYADLAMLAHSEDKLEWYRGLAEFHRRVGARRLVEKLDTIERDSLADLYGLNRERIRDIWLGYLKPPRRR